MSSSVKTLTFAYIYELYGLKEDALKIYRALLIEQPDSKEAQTAIKRLTLGSRQFPPTNQAQKQLFIDANTQEEIFQFQRWLLQWNSKI